MTPDDEAAAAIAQTLARVGIEEADLGGVARTIARPDVVASGVLATGVQARSAALERARQSRQRWLERRRAPAGVR